MKNRTILLTIPFLLALAPEADYNIVNAEAVSVTDGDTITVAVNIGLGISRIEKLRLLCVNTPEIFGSKAKTEGEAGKVASAFTKSWLQQHPLLVLRLIDNGRRGSFGRLLAAVYPRNGGKSLNQALLDSGNAVLFKCRNQANIQ